MAVDHYNTLGVLAGASAADLRAAYLKLARSNHPDMFVGAERERAQVKMQEINEAWNVLGVAHKRREYDASRPKEQQSRSTPGSSKARRGHAHFTPFDDDDLIDRSDIDLDATPIVGSRAIPRWATLSPIALFCIGFVVVGFGTLMNAGGVFLSGIVALVFGAVSFLMMPLIVMSRAERDPEL